MTAISVELDRFILQKIKNMHCQKATSPNAPKRRKNVRKGSGVGRNIIDANHTVSFQK